MSDLLTGKWNASGSGRVLSPELLDSLPPEDRRARRSRRDLRRVNACMGNARIVAGLIRRAAATESLRRLVELGGGDGAFMWRVAQRLRGLMRTADLTLVDRQSLLGPEVGGLFAAAGWRAQAEVADVFEWLENAKPTDVILANLFLHHFQNSELREMLRRVSGLCRVFIACEPRRISNAWAAGMLVGLLGGNAVTRHDATVSVRAGFVGSELSNLWPSDPGWHVQEREAGLFSHAFMASRR